MSFYSVDLTYRSDAFHYFASLANMPWAVWLDSGGLGRYDIMTAMPQRTLVLDDESTRDDPFALIRDELGDLVGRVDNVPFAGGALGYWGYDLARHLKMLPDRAGYTESIPAMMIGIYDWALVLDHERQTARLVSHQRYSETAALLEKILLSLESPTEHQVDTFQVHGKIQSNYTYQHYAEAFSQVQAYLKAGDCYQINLAQRFNVSASGDALEGYLNLRKLNPAPYSAYLNFPNLNIMCASPERFLRVSKGLVETRPIKGTRPRSDDATQDQRMADDLRQHHKDRAENLMIVDLLRNDLGKSCVPGSVHVPELFKVESYANVHHLVSTVEGKLADNHDALNVLKDCFPGGSVTGAPKHRAMQIIEQLEPDQRGIYCGSIGYVGFDGDMDSNIVIRTLIFSGNEVHYSAGGGIVADSNVESEYQETLDKASAMFELIKMHSAAL
ncbi:MAG: aminodeoxychorismate synthase component I [Gallionella sp.]